MRRKILMFVVVSLVCGALGCGFGGEKPSEDRGKILKVGTSADFPPFEFETTRHKEFQGFDMDLIRAVGEEMGFETDIGNFTFVELAPALEDKKIDLIISGLTITDERKKKMLFTEPYYHSGRAIVVRYDNYSINNFVDLKGKRVAVQEGGTGAEELKKIGGIDVKEFKNQPDMFMELNIGGVDAVVGDRPVNDYYIHNYGMASVKALDGVINTEDYGIAVHRDNEELRKKLDDALKKLHENGKFAKIYAKWFGNK